jgi:hypothetical protein
MILYLPRLSSWRYPDHMNLNGARTLLSVLERHPEHVQLHHVELDQTIKQLTEEIHRLARTGEDNKRKMRLVGVPLKRVSLPPCSSVHAYAAAANGVG